MDYFDIKQDVEQMLCNTLPGDLLYEASEHAALHPGQCARVSCANQLVGYVGTLHPTLASRYGLAKPMYLFEFVLNIWKDLSAPQYRPVSRYPAVRRDISIVVDAEVTANACLAAAREGAGSNLRDLQLFDVYRGQGIDSDKKSISLGLIFQDVSSTLTEEEVEVAVAQALNSLRERVGGILRE